MQAAIEFILYYLLADFISGVIHWLQDTYGAPGIFWGLLDKYVIIRNIDHHREPFRIAYNGYWQTNTVSIIVAASVAAVLAVLHLGTWQLYVVTAFGSQFNQIHAWAHSPRPPRVVRWLQAVGIFQSSWHHGVHHRRPYDVNYCIVSSYLNPILDKLKFWRGLEWLGALIGFKVARGSRARSGY